MVLHEYCYYGDIGEALHAIARDHDGCVRLP